MKKKLEARKSLASIMQDIEKKFGQGSVMMLGKTKRVNVDVIPTGSFSLDLALGVGGFPCGRIVEIYGPESSGKTTLALSVVAAAQRQGGQVAYIDAEHAMDPVYAKELGVDIEKLAISQPSDGEEALNIAETFVRSEGIAVVVIDSVAALTPRAEIEGEMGQSHMGLQARMMSQALRKLTAITAKTNTLIIFINQIRMNIGGYGNPETTAGGKALKFYASVRVDVRRKAQIKKGETVTGIRVGAKVVKNKVAPPFRVAEFDIMYHEGISFEADILNMGVKYGIVKKSGASYSFEGNKLGLGFDKIRKSLKEDQATAKAIAAAVTAKVEAGGEGVDFEAPEEEEPK